MIHFGFFATSIFYINPLRLQYVILRTRNPKTVATHVRIYTYMDCGAFTGV